MAQENLRDLYDEEFHANLQLAKNLMKKIPLKSDKDICKKWISKLFSLKSTDPLVKQNRNNFFKYMLQIMHKCTQPRNTEDEQNNDFPQYYEKFNENKKEGKEETKDYMSRWSGDGRTYIAAKPIPGRGTLVYMAVAQEPNLGWDHI